MSDPKKFPPPDDFAKTTPNLPRAEDTGTSDWEKTNYNVKFSPQPPPADDWGKTVTNIQVPPVSDEPDFNKTYYPSQPAAPNADWGVTNQNIKLPDHDFGGAGRENENPAYGTTPYIRLPDAERVKYQNLPPTPTEAANQKAIEEREQKKEGVPSWFWVAGGLISLFFFAIIAILVYYLWALRPSGFEIVVQNVPGRSEVWIDNQTKWGITDGDGTIRLQGLRAGSRHIDIKQQGTTCDSRDIDGEDGEVKTITARCVRITDGNGNNGGIRTDDDCKIPPALGQFDKAERCANLALDKLPPAPNFTAEQLTEALNIFIINFDKDKYTIPQSRMKFLERAAGFIKNLPSTTVLEVGGHTDDRNTDEYNQTLSDNRAKAVREALINFGVRADALQTKGYGESTPKVPNDSDENRFYNRRIEYKVIRR